MKKIILLLALISVIACDDGGHEKASGELRVSFSEAMFQTSGVRSEMPDTGEFILDITDSNGASIYSGTYAACPEVLSVPAGSYVVKAVSEEFNKPAFSAPQYGDEQCVIVPSGGVGEVKLLCSQVNAGIRLLIDPDFLTVYPDAAIFLKSSKGKLMYGYSEKRIAYFHPGQVSLILSDAGKDEVMMTRTLQAQEILSLKVNVSSTSSTTGGPAASVSIQVDTVRNWISDVYVLGDKSSQGNESSTSLTISQAKESIGEKDVWVSGYIVGGDLTSAAASFEGPFTSRTNILIGPKSSTSIKESCMSVQLPSGDLRDALNLVDNPSNIGKKVALKGDIVDAYFSIPGIKNISEYTLY